jgi:hypothetical protein
LSLPPDLKHQLLASVRVQGVSVRPPAGTSAKDAASIDHAVANAIASGARPALVLTFSVAAVGALMSFLIPRVHNRGTVEQTGDTDVSAQDNDVGAGTASARLH